MGPAEVGTAPARGGDRRLAGLRHQALPHARRHSARRPPAGSSSRASKSGGGVARVVRMRHTADTSFLGLSAARLSGSGIGIGIQAKGTAVIHQHGRLPHNNLELFSNAPITTLEHYRALGRNAAHLCARRDAGAGGRADARRGDGLALPCARRAPLRDRDVARRRRRRAGGDRGQLYGRRRHGRAQARRRRLSAGGEAARPDRGPARQARSTTITARRLVGGRGDARGPPHHAGGTAACRRRSRAPQDVPCWPRISSARRNWSTCRRMS